MPLEKKIKDQFSVKLLEWYKNNKRDLPWRHTNDPYKIWVSEVMLQQTQVQTVIPYYARFLERFPTVKTLAEADLSTVLKTWEGLGYYARARNLHKAAITIVNDYHGEIPAERSILLNIPGIGPYTAAAVASIAFNKHFAVVDGNVTRVLCRIFNIQKFSSDKQVKAQIARTATALLRAGKSSESNQALMELGALLCLPQNPNCSLCPLGELCEARRLLPDPSVLPRKKPKAILPHYDIAIGLVWKKDRVLIDQRPTNGLLGGLWEFPGGKKEPNETLAQCVVREIREEMGIEVSVQEPFLRVKHAYTHFKITLHSFHCRHVKGKASPKQAIACKWVKLKDLGEFAFPRANQKILEALIEAHS